MKLLTFGLLLTTLVACSGGSGEGEVTAGLSVSQKEAQKLIQNDIKHLQEAQYGISEADLALMKKEGLLSQKELNSLNVVR